MESRIVVKLLIELSSICAALSLSLKFATNPLLHIPKRCLLCYHHPDQIGFLSASHSKYVSVAVNVFCPNQKKVPLEPHPHTQTCWACFLKFLPYQLTFSFSAGSHGPSFIIWLGGHTNSQLSWLFYVHECFAYVNIDVPHVWLLPTEVRRRPWIAWNCYCKQL